MNKFIATLVALVTIVSTSFAGVTLGPPKSPSSDAFSAQSASITYDTSLLKAVVFFDGLDSSYMALNYDVGQLDGIFKNPLRLGFSAAMQGQNQVWGGPSVSYEIYNARRISLGLIGAMPGLTVSDNKLTFANDARIVWGATFSFKF